MALKEVRQDSRGNTLYVEDNEVGGHRYWSDEVGGGVVVWDTCLVSDEMVRLALDAEKASLAQKD
jgi:hypothetical protein